VGVVYIVRVDVFKFRLMIFTYFMKNEMQTPFRIISHSLEVHLYFPFNMFDTVNPFSYSSSTVTFLWSFYLLSSYLLFAC
jgi:hypothetical protein